MKNLFNIIKYILNQMVKRYGWVKIILVAVLIVPASFGAKFAITNAIAKMHTDIPNISMELVDTDGKQFITVYMEPIDKDSGRVIVTDSNGKQVVFKFNADDVKQNVHMDEKNNVAYVKFKSQ